MFILNGHNTTQRILAHALAQRKWAFQWSEKAPQSFSSSFTGAIAISSSNWDFLQSLSPIQGSPIYQIHLHYSHSCLGSLKHGLTFESQKLGVDRLGIIVPLDSLNAAFPFIEPPRSLPSSRSSLMISTERKERTDPQNSLPLGSSRQYIVHLEGKNINNSAFQLFDWPNIFGILPLSENQFCIIWNQITASPYGSDLLETYLSPLLSQIGVTLGKIEEYGSAIEVSSYHAKRYFDDKQHLRMGEAAHHLHPVAGQGLNLTLQDFRAFLSLSEKTSQKERAYYVEKSRFFPNQVLVNFCSQVVSPYARYWLPLAFRAPHLSAGISKIIAQMMQ